METTELLRLIIEIAGLALALGALAETLWLHSKTKIVLVVTVSLLIMLSSFAVLLSWQHERQVEMTSQDILNVIGPDVKTFDQVFHSLFQPEFPIANEAMGRLIKEGRIQASRRSR
jgi:hypothetical protein